MTKKKDPPASLGRSSPGSSSLLHLVPAVLRARGFRFYTQGGRRLVDLWQDGGAAVLGHTPAGILRELKNTAERGLFAPLPHPLEGRLHKALARLFPHRLFRLYAGEASFRRALCRAGYPADISPLDMALPDAYPAPTACPDPGAYVAGTPTACPGMGTPDKALSLWRPFTDGPPVPGLAGTAPDEGLPEGTPPQDEALSPELLLPVLPLPWTQALWVLAISPQTEAGRDFPPSDILSPVILAAAVRAVCGLVAAAPDRGNPQFHKLDNALRTGPWRRRGIYLWYGEAPDDASYETLFRRFLDRGFLLPPSRNLPAILPGILSPGEEARLAELLKRET
jgi:hypothetical protein